MKILVTGSTGLLGTNLVKKLKELKHEVVGVSRRTGIDLRYRDLAGMVMNNTKPDIVYHLAANAAEARGQISPIDMTERNMMIFLNVLRAAINAKVKRFIYISSVAVYGEAEVPYMEDGPTIPKDVYGVNKLACEMILKILAKVYNFEYVIFRPHNLYGPHQNMNDPYRNVVALFMRKALEGERYKLFGEGKMQRGFSYVEDVVDILVEALDNEKFTNKALNVGTESAITIKELSDLVQEVTGHFMEPEQAPARPLEIEVFLADHTRQRSMTNYKETPLKEGLKKTWEWAFFKGIGPLEKQENEIYV
jgi:UDP-glucose 4-epimerase